MAWQRSNENFNQPSFGGHSGGFGSHQSGYRGNTTQTKPSLAGIDPKDLPPIKKAFYSEHPEVAILDAAAVNEFRRKHEMVIRGESVPKPVSKFSHISWPREISKKVQEAGFDAPTPIQAQGWPMALSGQNMVGIAQTGSGKTISYLLPALQHILAQLPLENPSDGPIALVLAPTRELAVQIQEVARQYGNVVRVRNVCLYGGVPKGPQIRSVRQGAEIYVATPGRLLDMLAMTDQRDNSPLTSLRRVSYLVLDEADRMLDMGFEEPLRQIIGQIRGDRQVLMWSATWPKAVRRLAEDILGRNLIQVTIGSQELTANKKIKQEIIVCDARDKEEQLVKLFMKLWEELPVAEGEKQFPRTIVFCNKKRLCDDLVGKMLSDNWPAASMHGDKEQPERERVLREFKQGTKPILVCTDVAARGLDVRDVRVVINFDFPNNIEDYVHRIGRTARGNDVDGRALSLFTSDDRSLARELVGVMQDAGQSVPEELSAMAPPKRANNNGSGGRGGYRGGRGGGSHYGNGGWGGSQSNHSSRFRPY